MGDTDAWLDSYSRVSLTVEIPEDVYVGRQRDELKIVVPFCHEGIRPDGLSHQLHYAIQNAVMAAKAELTKKGYLNA